jgi:hypothetical protein
MLIGAERSQEGNQNGGEEKPLRLTRHQNELRASAVICALRLGENEWIGIASKKAGTFSRVA